MAEGVRGLGFLWLEHVTETLNEFKRTCLVHLEAG
jgi:hypothetical protein